LLAEREKANALSWIYRNLLSLPEQASSFAGSIDRLHFFVITVTLIGWGILTALTIFFFIRYRRRKGVHLKVHGPAPIWLEVGICGFLLTLFLVWWWIGFRQYIAIETPPAGALDVYVTAKQWMWKFTYPKGGSSIAVLTVPQGKAVRLIMTSQDVIHSLSVPSFRLKQDVLPGRYTLAWFESDMPGNYQILCAEYCGLSHSRMWGNVIVLPPAEYEKWLRGSQMNAPGVEDPPSSDLVTQGAKEAAGFGCLSCHTTDGRSHIGPTWLGLFNAKIRLSDGKSAVANEQYLTESMSDPMAKIVAGYPAVMPSYRGALEAGQTAAIVEFIKSLRAEDVPKIPSIPDWKKIR
jgi:cytochrome c oxidase subunit II